MHIAIPIHSFEPGGVERVALKLADRWQALGEHVTVVLGRSDGCCGSAAPALEYRSFPEPFPTARWETIWMIWCFYRYLSAAQVDVIFCPGNTYTIVCVAMRILLGKRCPPVLVKISNDLDRVDFPRAARPLYRLWVRIQGALLDHFVALAEPMLPEIIRELGIDGGKATVIADPALNERDLKRLSERTPRPERINYHFLSVGRLVPQKNHALLIEAFALHSWPDDRLIIAGEGPERTALESLVARFGLQARITLLGHSDDIPGLLRQSDVFVLSSDYEGLPAAVIEALAAGVPIATTNCCASMDWLLQHGQFGVTVQPRDPHGLGMAMNVARHLDPPLGQMENFAAQFTTERASGAYISIMRALCARRSGGHFRNLRERVRIS